jgi:hypothetical protein
LIVHPELSVILSPDEIGAKNLKWERKTSPFEKGRLRGILTNNSIPTEVGIQKRIKGLGLFNPLLYITKK